MESHSTESRSNTLRDRCWRLARRCYGSSILYASAETMDRSTTPWPSDPAGNCMPRPASDLHKRIPCTVRDCAIYRDSPPRQCTSYSPVESAAHRCSCVTPPCSYAIRKRLEDRPLVSFASLVEDLDAR